MDLDRMAASVLVVGFEGPALSDSVQTLIRRGISGCILFRRNLGSPGEIFTLNQQLKGFAKGRPLLSCVDQEGGRVARLRDGFTPIPPMRRLGDTGQTALAQAIGQILGEECKAVGFDLDFAPVVDVDSNPENPVIGDRSFGSSPKLCAELGAALIKGLQSAGVAACAKHFPGHGDTQSDSHHTLPRVSHDLERLRRIELPPFQSAVAAGVGSLMTAHVVCEALDPDLPATLSVKTLGFLRNAIGFEGVLISDDLEMSAISAQFDITEAAPLAIGAGCDLLLICHHFELQQKGIDAIRRWAEGSSDARERLQQAAARVETFRHRWAQTPTRFEPSALCNPAAMELVRRIAPPIHEKLLDPTG